MTTPEYLPPELLEMNLMKKVSAITNKLHPWSIDIWSFGVILVELAIGFPVWMAYKGRIIRKNENNQWIESSIMKGLLGSTGR